MRVFVAGATGAIGQRLVPKLVASGHDVVGMTSKPEKQDLVRELGAEPAVADALDAEAVGTAVSQAEPEAIIHELTGLSGGINLRKMDGELRAHQPAAHRGHRPPALGRARDRRAEVRRPELRRLALRQGRRDGEERG